MTTQCSGLEARNRRYLFYVTSQQIAFMWRLILQLKLINLEVLMILRLYIPNYLACKAHPCSSILYLDFRIRHPVVFVI